MDKAGTVLKTPTYIRGFDEVLHGVDHLVRQLP